jgi:hypothetical protein
MRPSDKITSFFGSMGGAVSPSKEKPKKAIGNDFRNENEDFDKAHKLAHSLTKTANEAHEHMGAHHAHSAAHWLAPSDEQEKKEEHNELAGHHASRAKEKYEELMDKE